MTITHSGILKNWRYISLASLQWRLRRSTFSIELIYQGGFDIFGVKGKMEEAELVFNEGYLCAVKGGRIGLTCQILGGRWHILILVVLKKHLSCPMRLPARIKARPLLTSFAGRPKAALLDAR